MKPSSKHQSAKTTAIGQQAQATPIKQQLKKSATAVAATIVSSSPDSDDSSKSASPEDVEKTGGIPNDTVITTTSSTTDDVVSTPMKPISISEAMANNYLVYDGKYGPPLHKQVSYVSKKSKEKVDKNVFSVDLTNKDSKIVTCVIWEDSLKVIPFFEKFFRYIHLSASILYSSI